MTEKAQSSTFEGSPRQDAPAAPARFLGRQPIVDDKSHLYGYELLFRSGTEVAFAGDPEQATRDVVDHWLMLIPEPGEGLAFVNCTRAALVEGVVSLLPAAGTVLEILETIEPDRELIESCRSLRGQGYRFALDDFAPLASRASLIEFADYIKIDFLASDAAARREIYAMAAGTGAQLLAEKIETEKEMRVARSEGCSLFQGYFFSRPVIVSSRLLPQNHLVYLRLLTELNQDRVDLGKVEDLVMSDASLCYRVLRLANSAMHGLSGTITTVRGALLMVGENPVRRMVSVAVALTLGNSRSPALVSMALTRAHFCELLAPDLDAQPQQLYLLGMLSLLDVLLETPMNRILNSLPLDAAMKAALLGQSGPLTPALDLVRCLESCDGQRCEALRQSLNLTESSVASNYVEALRWASKALHS